MIALIRQKIPARFWQGKWAAHLSLLSSALLMGTAYVGAKLALQGVGPFTTAFLPDHLFGDFLIVLNALSGALGVLFGKRLLKEYKPFTVLVYQITIGMIGLLPLALFESGGQFSLA